MHHQADHKGLKATLILPWIVVGIMLVTLIAYIIICQTLGEQLQAPLPEAQRVLVRTVLYAVAIMTFPLTNLIRHIQLRLNQTMPYSGQNAPEVAKSRYLATIIVSMSLIEAVGIFGFVMFILGDGFNTLYIFTGLSALGLFLYRPKSHEYIRIIEALVRAES